MDYEKAYKAVLQTATQWIKDGCTDKEKICLECVFPELRESEDERITRAINNMLPFIPDEAYANNGVTKEGVLNWLEKQKEQSLRDFIDDFPYSDQKEQKPAEWSEEDNIGWDEAFACVTRAEKAAKNEEELQNAVTAEKWLKEIKFKYYIHPVKQEWSEEDKERYISCLQRLGTGDPKQPETINSKWFREHISFNSWKPSEEQMEALDVAATDYEELDELDVAILGMLYDELKKLM